MGQRARVARFPARPHAPAPRPQYDFVSDVSALLTVGQEVDAWVLNVDAFPERGFTPRAPRRAQDMLGAHARSSVAGL